MRGERAEQRALAHLLGLGHTLLARNYRIPGGEIDLITRAPGGETVFTEVRQRGGRRYGSALETVTPRKVALLRRAALAYLGRDDLPCRFDVIAIDGDADRGTLLHLEGAF
ncbi:putative endonuclease [Deinobacterium chartae]|uniref:UPF0102 protein HNR42_003396 n=1 Tax=Deinobacterium chartae TaxID=521158 RepID=A0A841I4I5_9DEIO|nr:YraN family protein [Deinobacterium chartae]MBB6099936.1 putative endonuclease [Deinobacterium chartae]